MVSPPWNHRRTNLLTPIFQRPLDWWLSGRSFPGGTFVPIRQSFFRSILLSEFVETKAQFEGVRR